MEIEFQKTLFFPLIRKHFRIHLILEKTQLILKFLNSVLTFKFILDNIFKLCYNFINK